MQHLREQAELACLSLDLKYEAAVALLPLGVQTMTVKEYIEYLREESNPRPTRKTRRAADKPLERKPARKATKASKQAMEEVTETVKVNKVGREIPQTPSLNAQLPETPLRSNARSTIQPRRITLRSSRSSIASTADPVEQEEEDLENVDPLSSMLQFAIEDGKTVVRMDMSSLSPSTIKNLDGDVKRQVLDRMQEMRSRLDSLLGG